MGMGMGKGEGEERIKHMQDDLSTRTIRSMCMIME